MFDCPKANSTAVLGFGVNSRLLTCRRPAGFVKLTFTGSIALSVQGASR
jgi:hypothetical protein